MFNNEEEIQPSGPYGGSVKELMAMQDRNPTITERLKQQKREMEFRLAEINSVIEALESDPKIQKVVDAVSKIRGI